ncbi:fumarylacetoacetate hydrolase family protein, partial [Acinetobacter baumannii]
TETKDCHYEIELVVAIGTGGRDIAVETAANHIYGYAIGLDMTRRDLQNAAKKGGRPWETGKAFDGSAPIGPIVPVKDVGHPDKGAITLAVNGVQKQHGDLADMIWHQAEIVSN